MKNGKITKESKLAQNEIKKIQDEHERQELLFNREALIPKPTFDRQLEVHELQNGTKFTIKDLLNIEVAEYLPVFPNTNPFFKLMFKLNGWKGDPTDFIKPPPCPVYIKKYIYGRYDSDMLPTLLSKTNPLISGHIRKYKLFQFLNEKGRRMLEGFVQDAVDVMNDSTDWYDFEQKYTKKYNLPLQLKCIR